MVNISNTARTRAEMIAHYMDERFQFDERFANHCAKTTPIFHCFISGVHVDPDAGREYVSLSKPTTPECRQRIRERNRKVNRIFRHIRDSLISGIAAEQISDELQGMQNFIAVGFASSPTEVGIVLTKMFREDYLCAGSVEDDVIVPVANAGFLFKWREAISCFGGTTDRYTAARLAREADRNDPEQQIKFCSFPRDRTD